MNNVTAERNKPPRRESMQDRKLSQAKIKTENSSKIYIGRSVNQLKNV